jgi:hypothetical protein
MTPPAARDNAGRDDTSGISYAYDNANRLTGVTQGAISDPSGSQVQ